MSKGKNEYSYTKEGFEKLAKNYMEEHERRYKRMLSGTISGENFDQWKIDNISTLLRYFICYVAITKGNIFIIFNLLMLPEDTIKRIYQPVEEDKDQSC